jgi:hypothetical protein
LGNDRDIRSGAQPETPSNLLNRPRAHHAQCWAAESTRPVHEIGLHDIGVGEDVPGADARDEVDDEIAGHGRILPEPINDNAVLHATVMYSIPR